MQPKLFVEQKITPLVNQYRIYQAAADGSKGPLVAFAQQKRLAFKEKVTFYTDEQKTTERFSFRAEKALDVHGRFFVEDETGAQIGSFQKSFKQSLLNSTWNIPSTSQPVVTISEKNQLLAIIRRIGGFLPFIGEILDLVTSFIRYHFVFVDRATGNTIGQYRKTRRFYDYYELSMDDDSYEAQDWRVWAAMAVALDALQGR